MNDNELRKKLSVLKSTPPPKGYWDNYWPRLKMKLDRPVENASALAPNSWFRPWVPVCAGLLLAVGGYWFGQQNRVAPISSNAIVLVSDSSESKANRVFREMLELFPSRIHWISFADGKVDFSISSVAYKKDETLIPLMLSFPLGKETIHVQLLLRPGQEARVHAPFQGKAVLDAKLVSDAKGKTFQADIELSEGGTRVSLQGGTPLKEGEAVTLGSVRWNGKLVPAHLARPMADPS